jgi:hypothetical protein
MAQVKVVWMNNDGAGFLAMQVSNTIVLTALLRRNEHRAIHGGGLLAGCSGYSIGLYGAKITNREMKTFFLAFLLGR